MVLTARLFAIATLGLAASLAARADDPVGGAALYASHCKSCHGSSPLTSNTSKIYNGRNARAVIDAAIGSVSDMNSLRTTFPAGSSSLADIAAYLGNTPGTLAFASTALGSSSATQTVTVNASLKSGYAISGLAVTVSGDFARSGGTCATTLATGTSCTIAVAFTPTASGTRSGTLGITDNNTLTPVSIALTGSGAAGAQAPVASIAPVALTLASTAIGATSAAQNVSVGNTGTAPLTIASIALGSNDFVIAGGTCSAGGSVAVGASCTVSVAFTPTAGAVGARSGSLVITDNAAGSPTSVALSGTATAAAAPAAALTAALAFGNVNVAATSATQTATLSNTGNAPLAISSIATSSSDFAVTGGTCAAGSSVAAAASCSVNLAFTPAAAGARSGALTIAHNAPGGQSTSSLSGTGVALNPVIALSPSTLSFSQTTGSTSLAQTVTVSNTGTAPLSIVSLSIGGAQAAEFQTVAGTTCSAGASVAANSSCAIKVAFTPAASGARSASLSIAHNAPGSPSSVTLNGTGTATPQPSISLNATTLSFAAQTLGSASAGQSVTVSNSGAATLTLGAFTLTGSAAGDFTQSGSCTSGATLNVGASCTLGFSFTPAAVGARSATLTLASNASNGAAVLSLAGTGAAAAAPSASITPGALDFGNQTIGVASSAHTVMLANSGSGALGISGIVASAGFTVSDNCGASLAAGASCALVVVFTPTTAGAATGTLSVASNAAGSPNVVNLSGSGVVASPVLVWSPATAALSFADTALGATTSTQSLVLLNQGPGSAVVQGFSLAGAQAADFSVASGSTCAAGSALAAGASCTIGIAFLPGAVGPRDATLQVLSSASNPPAIALAGNGVAMALPAASVTPGTLTFDVPAGASSVPTQTLTLQSTGNAVLHVSALRIASGSFTLDGAATSGCPAAPFDMMPGQSCGLAVGWSSSTAAGETGMVEIDTSATAAPLSVAIQAVQTAPAPAMSNVGAGAADTWFCLSLLLAIALLMVARSLLSLPSPQDPR
jgi:hypothetical protein